MSVIAGIARTLGLAQVADLFDCTMIGHDTDTPLAEQLLTEAEAEREVFEPLGPRISGDDNGLHDFPRTPWTGAVAAEPADPTPRRVGHPTRTAILAAHCESVTGPGSVCGCGQPFTGTTTWAEHVLALLDAAVPEIHLLGCGDGRQHEPK